MFHALFEVALDVLKRTKVGYGAQSNATGDHRDELRFDSRRSIGDEDRSETSPRPPIVAGQWERAAPGEPLQM